MAKADKNFKLDEFINSGLYGVVWRATQKQPHRTVAIKVVNVEHGMTFNATEHAQGLVKAGPHPNIVDVYQVTQVKHPTTGDIVDAVVMEWLDGDSLGIRLGKSPRLTADSASNICEGVLNGIEHLHANGVTHSDLHVGNVILTEQGPRIIDIDYSSAKSLARLTTLDRQFQIAADVTQVAHIVGMILRRTDVPAGIYQDHEEVLRDSTDLNQVRNIMKEVFRTARLAENAAAPVILPPPRQRITPQSQEEAVESAIERRRLVTLRQIIMDSANGIVRDITSDRFTAEGAYSRDELRNRLASYQEILDSLLPSLSSIGFWGGPRVNALAVEAIDRLANAYEKERRENGVMAYLALRKYPELAAMYSTGIGAIAGENYEGLFSILRDTVFYRFGISKDKLWTDLVYSVMENQESWNQIIGRDVYFPVSQILEQNLREPLIRTIPSDVRYIDKFDRFEFFASLDHFLFNRHSPGASFLWRRRDRSDTDLVTEIIKEASAAGASWVPLRAGLLNGTGRTDILEVLEEYRKSINETRARFRM